MSRSASPRAGGASSLSIVSVMAKSSADDAPQRGRPRDPAVEDKVFSAAMVELAEAGFEGFSVRSIARRSGVSRPSLLLRWPTRDALILETVERLVEWPKPNVDAPFLDELKAIVARIVELMDPTLLDIQLRIVADAPRHPELFAAYQDKVMTKAATRLSTLLARAVADGELPEHIDCRWAADALVGVVFMRSIASRGRRPLSASAQGRIISTFLNTMRGGKR
jgi:AcrR family transcriptional regulator